MDFPTFLGAFLALLSLVAADRGPVDWYDCKGKPDANYRHPSDCSKFMTCVAQFYAYERDCVAGLHYDLATDRCEWPELVGCVTDPPTTTAAPTTTTPSTTTRPTTTPTTTSPSTTEPSTTTPRTEPSTTTQNPIGNFCNGRPDGNYPHPTNCSKFISCVAGELVYEMDCPAGLHYDPRTDQCDYPEVAGCDPRFTTTTERTTPETTTLPPDTTTQTPETTTQTDGTTTQTEQTTTQTEQTTTQTPETTTQTPETTTQTEQTTTQTEQTSTETETPTPEPTTTNQTEESSTPYSTTELTTTEPTSTTTNQSSTTTPPTTVDPDACDHDCEYVGIDCHNYYSCTNFTRKEYHECNYEQGLAFNPSLKTCDRIENVEGCRPNSTEPTTTPSPEEGCICEYRPHENDCSKYYFCPDSCRNSSCQVRACPGDLLWSVDFYGDGSAHQQCSVPENANCVSAGGGGSRLEFSCFRRADGLYKNEKDCRSYWKCQGGSSLLYDCPKGYVYNSDVESCDFEARSFRFCANNELI